MSYDFWIEMDAGGDHPLTVDPDFCSDVKLPERVRAIVGDDARIGSNYTSNVWKMFKAALGIGLPDLAGRRCGDIADQIAGAVDAMLHRPDLYRQWEPGNGWGDYEGALTYLAGIEAFCRAYPNATLGISA